VLNSTVMPFTVPHAAAAEPSDTVHLDERTIALGAQSPRRCGAPLLQLEFKWHLLLVVHAVQIRPRTAAAGSLLAKTAPGSLWKLPVPRCAMSLSM